MTQKRGFLFGAEGKHHQHFGAQDKKHSENLLLGYSPQQLYDVVANVSDYKNFLPYCIDSRVLTRYGNGEMDAELVVGFKPFTERYTSRVILSEPHTITSEVRSGKMFKHLKSVWSFKPGPNPNTCFLTFSVEFQFSSSLHQRMANLFFTEVVLAMSAAFEKRCREVYGPGSCPAKKVLSTTT